MLITFGLTSYTHAQPIEVSFCEQAEFRKCTDSKIVFLIDTIATDTLNECRLLLMCDDKIIYNFDISSLRMVEKIRWKYTPNPSFPNNWFYISQALQIFDDEDNSYMFRPCSEGPDWVANGVYRQKQWKDVRKLKEFLKIYIKRCEKNWLYY